MAPRFKRMLRTAQDWSVWLVRKLTSTETWQNFEYGDYAIVTAATAASLNDDEDHDVTGRRQLEKAAAYLDYRSSLKVRGSRLNCDVCGNERNERSLVSCQVCDRSFHRKCLLRKRIFVLNPDWTCPNCEAVWRLLSDEESVDIMYLPLTTVINRDKFYKIWPHRLLDSKSPKTEFDELDHLQTGALTHKVFKTAVTLAYLCLRKKEELVCLLTSKEVERLREMFEALDPLRSGRLVNGDARRVVRLWMMRARVDPVAAEKYSINLNMKLTNGFVTWSDFLLDLAILVLACRPNLVNGRDYLWLVF